MNEKNNAVILLLGRRYKNCFKYPLIVSSLCSQNSLHGFWIWSHQQSTIYDGNSWLACNQFSLGKIHVQKHLNSSWKEIPKILIPETRIDWIFPVNKLKVTHGLLRSAGPCRALGNFSVASKIDPTALNLAGCKYTAASRRRKDFSFVIHIGESQVYLKITAWVWWVGRYESRYRYPFARHTDKKYIASRRLRTLQMSNCRGQKPGNGMKNNVW